MAVLASMFTTVCALACAILLLRGWSRSRSHLLFWSGLCFVGLTVANATVVLDLGMLRQVDLYAIRLSVTAASLVVLVLGFIWQKD